MSEDNFDVQEKESSLPFLGTMEQILAKYEQTSENYKNSLEEYIAKVLEGNPLSSKDSN